MSNVSPLLRPALAMTTAKIFPTEHTDSELESRAADLSRRIVEYDHKTGNGEDLIKDSVLFNATYIELQNRRSARVSTLMVRLTWVSAFVALASLLVAWLSYDATRSGDKWQEEQRALLTQMANDLSAMRKDQQQSQAKPPPLSPSSVKSGANPSFQGTRRDKAAARP